MNFFNKIIDLYYSLKNYFSFHHHVQIILNEAGIILFMLNPKNLAIITKTNSYDFNHAMISDDKFKIFMRTLIDSLSMSQHTIHACVHLNKKYYNLSVHCVYKNVLFVKKRKYIMCLANDITIQVKTHHITYDAYHEQLRTNKMKMAFLSRMSHEFRTPLNAVIGFSDAIKNKIYGSIPAPYLEYVNNIHEAGSHLLDIVNDIMDVSFHEHHDFNLNISAFSPKGAIDTILQFIHCLLTKQKITVNVVSELPDDFMIHTDYNVFKRIIINIIGNATKYCPEYTAMDIKLSQSDNNMLSIYIRDYGIGFPETVIDNFGVPFNVGENFLTDTNNSIGLGLSIIKTSIQGMNGTVRIYNHIDGGAVIALQIPILPLVSYSNPMNLIPIQNTKMYQKK